MFNRFIPSPAMYVKRLIAERTLVCLSGLLLIVFFSCNRGDSPREVAETFLGYMAANDFERAKELGTEETDRLMDMLNGFKKMVSDSTQLEEHNFSIVAEKIEGNVATYTYEDKNKGPEAGVESLTLVKEDGKWKVAMNKENYNEGVSESLEVGGTSTNPE